MHRAAVNIGVGDDGFAFFIIPFNARLHCAPDDNIDNILCQIHQADEFVRQHRTAVLQLAHLQHIVDERQQMVGCHLHLFLVLPHQLFIIKMGFVDFQKPDDPVERGADIMTHAAEKIGFGFVRPAGVCRSILKIFLVGRFAGFLIVDVAHRQNQMCNVAVRIPAFHDQAYQIPCVVLPL